MIKRVISLFLFLFLVDLSSGMNCPDQCTCKEDTKTTDCSHLGLTVFPEGVDETTKTLLLHDNAILHLPISLGFPHLERFNASGNYLQRLEWALFIGMQALTELDLSRNQLSAIDERAFQYNGFLQHLDLSYNMIEVLPDAFHYLPSLKRLWLSHNAIFSFPERAFYDLGSLEDLSLTGNRLELLYAFPPQLFNVPSLLHLDLSSCGLREIPNEAFIKLVHLRHLNISDNRLSALPSLAQMEKLEELDVSRNRLITWGIDIGTLRFLDIGWNPELPTMGRMESLEQLNMQGLNMGYFNFDTVRSYSKLRVLDLSRNGLNSVDFSRVNESVLALEYLNLSHNALEDVPDALSAQPAVRGSLAHHVAIMDLSYNVLKSSPKLLHLGHMRNLTQLSLAHNLLNERSGWYACGTIDSCANVDSLSFCGWCHSLGMAVEGTAAGPSDARIQCNRMPGDWVVNATHCLNSTFQAGMANASGCSTNFGFNGTSVWGGEWEYTDHSFTLRLGEMPSIRHLDISHNRLLGLPSDFVLQACHLTDLIVHGNEISLLAMFNGIDHQKLESLTIGGSETLLLPTLYYPNLKRLHMREVHISEPQYTMFENLTSLTSLVWTFSPSFGISRWVDATLSEKEAATARPQTPEQVTKQLCETLFKTNIHLREIHTEYVWMGAFSASCVHGPLETLVMRHAGLHSMEDVHLLDKLRILDLSFNTDLDSMASISLGRLPLLHMLRLKNCSVYSLSSSFLMHLPNLQTLDMSNNLLTGIPVGCFRFNPVLKSVDFSNNALTALNKGVFSGVPMLTSVNVSMNHIPRLDSFIFEHLPRLYMVDFRWNPIEYFIENVFYEAPIKKMWLSANKTEKKRIKLARHFLRGISPLEIGIESFGTIEGMTYDDGQSVFDHVGHSLKVLNLGHNQLETVDDAMLKSLKMLKWLSLESNKLQRLTNSSFNGLLNLETLILDHNKLTAIPEYALSTNSRLVTLSANNNTLTSLPLHLFASTHHLQNVWLGKNKITGFPHGLFDATYVLQSIDLHGNSRLSCCGLLDLVHMMTTPSIQGAMKDIECSLPDFIDFDRVKATAKNISVTALNAPGLARACYAFDSPCAVNNGGCSANAHCFAVMGSPIPACECKEAYFGDGITCKKFNPCNYKNGGCDEHAICTHTDDKSTVCQCMFGYKGDGIMCIAFNPCDKQNGGCPANSTCTMTKEKVECECLWGFELSDNECMAIDLCKQDNGGCHKNAHCKVEQMGDAPTCKCADGYTGSGFICVQNPQNPETTSTILILVGLVSIAILFILALFFLSTLITKKLEKEVTETQAYGILRFANLDFE
eukprot:Nk52_evm5s462 gene=Nk52_evmTU5s462